MNTKGKNLDFTIFSKKEADTMSLSLRKKGMKTITAAAALLVGALALLGYLFINTSVAREAPPAVEAGVKAVAPVEVCMVNDKVFGKPQIPVEFEGKTYYGCCAGCVNRIKNDRRVRYSVDPVSGAEVDKAKAVIVEGPGGEAIYFESLTTAREYMTEGGG